MDDPIFWPKLNKLNRTKNGQKNKRQGFLVKKPHKYLCEEIVGVEVSAVQNTGPQPG
jgi:hypothetical protein